MARKTQVQALVRVLVSFNDVQAGDEAILPIDTRVQGWISAGLVEVVPDGTGAAGPGKPAKDDDKRVPAGTEGSLPTGGEPGEGFGSGAYGTAEGFDQG